MGDRAMENTGGIQVSLSEVIEGIEREMFERATKEEKPKYCDDCKVYEESKDCHACIKQEFNDRRRKSE
jgi:hypothetical protein